jgi:hypothetical protein
LSYSRKKGREQITYNCFVVSIVIYPTWTFASYLFCSISNRITSQAPRLANNTRESFNPILEKTAAMAAPSNGSHGYPQKINNLAKNIADNKDNLAMINAIPVPTLDQFLEQEDVGKPNHLYRKYADSIVLNVGREGRSPRSYTHCS